MAMLTFHRTKRGGDDFHVINEGQRVGRIYRTTDARTEWWSWEINIVLVSPGAQRKGVADSRALAMSAFREAWTGVSSGGSAQPSNLRHPNCRKSYLRRAGLLPARPFFCGSRG